MPSCWAQGKMFTTYVNWRIPLELLLNLFTMFCCQAWLGTPCIYVLDCSAAGFIINSFKTMMDTRQQQLLLQQQAAAAAAGGADPGALNGGMLGALPSMGDPMKEVIVLAACGGNELLPQVRAGGGGVTLSWLNAASVWVAGVRHCVILIWVYLSDELEGGYD